MPKLWSTYKMGMKNYSPKTPKKDKLTIGMVCYSVLVPMLVIILIFASINFILFYILLIKNKGYFDPETIKFSIYLIIGAYFFLILDKKKVREAFNIKDLPYINRKY